MDWGPQKSFNSKESSQEFSEQFGASVHKTKGFSRNSPQKVHPNFAENLRREILGNAFSGLKWKGWPPGGGVVRGGCL